MSGRSSPRSRDAGWSGKVVLYCHRCEECGEHCEARGNLLDVYASKKCSGSWNSAPAAAVPHFWVENNDCTVAAPAQSAFLYLLSTHVECSVPERGLGV